MTDRHTSAPARRLRFESLHPESAATTLELFFDLVFVFALTQVTAFMAKDPGAERLTQGMLMMGLLWWCWVAYSWLGNVVKADEGAPRLAMLTAMGALPRRPAPPRGAQPRDLTECQKCRKWPP